MDISSDSTLIATGSADRNIKIWGLDFGDCHKSLFAHDDSVTGIAFVPRTHYLFTCGKDGKVKEWDADSFQKILTLQVNISVILLKFVITVLLYDWYVIRVTLDKHLIVQFHLMEYMLLLVALIK